MRLILLPKGRSRTVGWLHCCHDTRASFGIRLAQLHHSGVHTRYQTCWGVDARLCRCMGPGCGPSAAVATRFAEAQCGTWWPAGDWRAHPIGSSPSGQALQPGSVEVQLKKVQATAKAFIPPVATSSLSTRAGIAEMHQVERVGIFCWWGRRGDGGASPGRAHCGRQAGR